MRGAAPGGLGRGSGGRETAPPDSASGSSDAFVLRLMSAFRADPDCSPRLSITPILFQILADPALVLVGPIFSTLSSMWVP